MGRPLETVDITKTLLFIGFFGFLGFEISKTMLFIGFFGFFGFWGSEKL